MVIVVNIIVTTTVATITTMIAIIISMIRTHADHDDVSGHGSDDGSDYGDCPMMMVVTAMMVLP